MFTRRSFLQSAAFVPSLLSANAFAQDTKPAVTQPPPIDFANLPYQGMVTAMAERWRRDYGLPGVWCAFIKDGRVQACVASGTRKVGEDLPASVNDHLNIGSVSKVITGSMIAFFVADGTIKYETTVGEVFPELAKLYPQSPLLKATLRQLMTHTAGLPPYPSKSRTTVGTQYRMEELHLSFNDPRVTEPGRNYEYSYGANVAVAMVERIKSTAFESWLSAGILKRMGIASPRNVSEWTHNEVYPHYLEPSGTTLGLLHLSNKAFDVAGAFSIQIADLCAFALWTMNNTSKLPEQIYYDMTHRPDDGLKSDTSASWHIASRGYTFHDGNTGRGELATAQVDVKRKRALLFYTNANFREAVGGSSHGGANGTFGLIGKEKLALFLK